MSEMAVQPVPVDLNDPLADLDQAFRLAKMLAQSSMVPQALRGNPQNCLITMLLGRELGLSWIQAIRGIYVLPSGQPGLRGTLLLARIRAAGHRYEFLESDDACEFVVTRKDEEFKIRYTGKFTLADAQAAGLVRDVDGKLVARSRSGEPLPWELYRRDMLQWRAVARGAARGCPELIFGFDLAGIGDGEDTGTVTAEVIPQPIHPNGGKQEEEYVRERLAELDREHAASQPPQPSDQAASEPTELTAGAADAAYNLSAEKPAPRLPDLQNMLRRCGFTGEAQTRACSVLVHREVADMEDLTPGEIFMAVGTITRVAWGEASMKARHDALEQYLQTEGETEDEADEVP